MINLDMFNCLEPNQICFVSILHDTVQELKGIENITVHVYNTGIDTKEDEAYFVRGTASRLYDLGLDSHFRSTLGWMLINKIVIRYDSVWFFNRIETYECMRRIWNLKETYHG